MVTRPQDINNLEGRITALEDLAQMIIEGESATEDLRTFMYHMWLHKAKELRGV